MPRNKGIHFVTSWPEGIRGFYLRDAEKFPVGCVATKHSKDEFGEHLVVAVSVVNPKDRGKNYRPGLNKKRVIEYLTENREEKLHYLTASGNIKLRIMKYLASDDFPSQQAREAARLWLQNYIPHPPKVVAIDTPGEYLALPAPVYIDPQGYVRETSL